MSFSENLKAIRQEKNISQEQLAEMLNVSRQAVSKWEQSVGYPETENLIQIAKKLDVSLDTLLLDNQLVEEAGNDAKENVVIFPSTSKIVIEYNKGQSISAFYKFRVSKMLALFSKKGTPKYVLLGTDSSSFLGDSLTELGYYLTQEDAQEELQAIKAAMDKGHHAYQLQFVCEIKPSWLSFVK